METLALSQENTSARFDRAGMSNAFAESSISSPGAAVETYAIIRSLLLLTFTTNIFAVFAAQEDAAGEDGGG